MSNLLAIFFEGQDLTWIIYVVLGVLLVGMVVSTVFMQKKQRKQQTETMGALKVGDVIITIGGVKGEVIAINADETIVVKTGTDENPSTLTFFKGAIQMINPDMNQLMGKKSVADADVEKKVNEDFDIDQSQYEIEKKDSNEETSLNDEN